MQMRLIESVRSAYRGNFLPTRHGLAAMDEHRVHVAIKRIDILDHPIFTITVAHDHDVAPAHVTIPRENHHPIANTVNRVAEVGVAAANSIPIFAKMA